MFKSWFQTIGFWLVVLPAAYLLYIMLISPRTEGYGPSGNAVIFGIILFPVWGLGIFLFLTGTVGRLFPGKRKERKDTVPKHPARPGTDG